MNWYKIAQQISFDFWKDPLQREQYAIQNPNDFNPVVPPDFKIQLEPDTHLEDYIDEVDNEKDLLTLFDVYQVGYDIYTLNNGDRVLRFDDSLIELNDDGYYSVSNAIDWVRDKEMYIHQYVDQPDFNEDFWQSIGDGYTVYHGTREDRVDDIIKNGLEPRDEARGLSNRSMGSGVFTSPDPDTAQYSYDKVFEIDVGAMKRDGYMPEVIGEAPIEDAEMLSSLAHQLDIDDADFSEAYSSDGLDPATVVFQDTIPPKYLKLLE